MKNIIYNKKQIYLFNRFITYVTLLSTSLIISCQQEPKQQSIKETPIAKPKEENFWQKTPQFNADTCFEYIQYQVQLGPRQPGSKAHQQCIQYIKKHFEKLNWQVELQQFPATTYDNKQWIGTNIIAHYKPELKHRILLCAHYDTRPFADRDIAANKKTPILGANDGASGVAVLMSIAQHIQESPLNNIGIDIVFFDLEDYGNPGGDSETWCLGSQYWAKNFPATQKKPFEGILLDMVGDTNAVFPKEAISIRYHPVLVHTLWQIAQKAGYSNYFIDESTNEITDDHLFINLYANIPCIDIIHYYPNKSDFFEHHHKVSDDLKNISKSTLKAVGQTVLYYLYRQEEKNSPNN